MRHHKIIYILLLVLNFLFAQINLSISEYRPFPDQISILEIQPTKISWSIANRFLLMDQYQRDLLELGTFGDVTLSTVNSLSSQSYGEIVWMGLSPSGIWVLDRIENTISQLDYRLNPIRLDQLDIRIFPEDAALDSWGRIFLFSRTYNGIYVYEDNEFNDMPFIDFSREFQTSFCLKDMEINEDGEMAILDCTGDIHIFNLLGEKQVTYKANIQNPEFLAPLRSYWVVFNRQGLGVDIQSNESLQIPAASIPVVDIKTQNKSIAVLSRDHILILNAKFN